MLSPEDALHALLKALPRCCNCQAAYASVIDNHRWPLCEKCWKAVPGSDDEKPLVDMRKEISQANVSLHISLSHSMARIPSYHEIPPPPSEPVPSPVTIDLEEISNRNKKLRQKIRHMRELRITSERRAALYGLFLGIVLTSIVFALLHFT